jgi:energy-coupling factor transporter ATP-binding protein EcfA2
VQQHGGRRGFGAEEEKPDDRQETGRRLEEAATRMQNITPRYGMVPSGEIVQLTGTAGSGESGKSTIVKQMKIIHQNGYTQDELSLYRLTIYKNLVDCVKALTGAMSQFDLMPKDPRVIELVDYINEYTVEPDPHTPLHPKAAEAVEAIWHDDVIPKVMEHQSEFYMMDSAP